MLSLAYLLKRFHGNSMKGIPERMDVGRSPESFADRYRRFRIVTARGEEAQRVRGLSIGADDYVVKPFSVPELMARVRALLRRTRPERIADRLCAGDIDLDRETQRVRRGERDIRLGPTEFRLLEHLLEKPGRVFSRAQLLDRIWGQTAEIDERTVDVHVGRLRKRLSKGRERDPIRTVRNIGYAFDETFGKGKSAAARQM